MQSGHDGPIWNFDCYRCSGTVVMRTLLTNIYTHIRNLLHVLIPQYDNNLKHKCAGVTGNMGIRNM